MRYIAVIFAFIQCCYAETVINTKEEFQHFVYETGWRANAKNCSARDKDKWYNDKIYEDSIYKVIPQAIADCMQGKAEFENVGKIVTFEANDHTKYSYENWNAVVLWNYLYFAIYKGKSLSNEGVEDVGDVLKTYYKNEYDGAIEKAVSDIQTYATDLNLYDYIEGVQSNHNNNKYYTVQQEFKTANKSAIIHLKPCNITIYIQNSIVSGHKPALNTVPTSKDEIHALPNFAGIRNENGVDISANKCWFNSVMLNLYNSKTIHKVIKDLQAKSHDKTMPSYWIQKIFNDIRTGDMSHYGDHLKGLIRTIKVANLTKYNEELTEEIISKLNTSEQQSSDTGYRLLVDSLKLEGTIKGIDVHSNWEISYETEDGETEILNSVDVYSGDTDVNTALDGTIYSHDVIQKYDDGKKERIHITLKNQNLPKLLVFLRAEEWNKDPIRTPRILNLKAEDGMHRYRLIGVVDDDPAIGHHVEAQIEIVQEYYRANDLRNPRVERIHFNESSTLRQMAFYEEEK